MNYSTDQSGVFFLTDVIVCDMNVEHSARLFVLCNTNFFL